MLPSPQNPLTDGILEICTALLLEKHRFVLVELLPKAAGHPTVHDQIQKAIRWNKTENTEWDTLTDIEHNKTTFVLGKKQTFLCRFTHQPSNEPENLIDRYSGKLPVV